MKKKLLILFVLSIVLVSMSVVGGKMVVGRSFSAGESTPGSVVVIDSALQETILSFEDRIRGALEDEHIPGLAVAVVKDSQIIYQKGFGLREAGTKDSVDIHTVFRLASLSKGFAPVLTATLVEDSCIHWDDKVAGYLPGFSLKSKTNTLQLNLRHVLSHTTGLPRHAYSNLLNTGAPYEQIREMLRRVDNPHPVGTYYNYQNVAYSLIGDVVTTATGKPYGELLQERIFAPAGMKDASTSYEAFAACRNKALPHGIGEEGPYRMELSDTYYSVGPAAGVNASIADMARWMLVLLGNRPDIVSDSSLQEVFKPHIEVSTREKNMRSWKTLDQAFYALGWRVLNLPERRLIYHGGYVNGYRSEIALDLEEKVGICVLSNGASWFMSECIETFFDRYSYASAASMAQGMNRVSE